EPVRIRPAALARGVPGGRQHRFGGIRVDEAVGSLATKLGGGDLLAECRPVRSIFGHGVVAVSGSHEWGGRVELRSAEALAVPRAIETLVVAGRDRVERGETG